MTKLKLGKQQNYEKNKQKKAKLGIPLWDPPAFGCQPAIRSHNIFFTFFLRFG